MSTDTDLTRAEELFAFLQGMPGGCRVAKSHRPKLTPEQAWSVIWYLGNQYWQVPDHIERCDICGDLFDTHSGGDCLDYGKGPYHFCDNCMCSDDYVRKSNSRLNPENKKAKR